MSAITHRNRASQLVDFDNMRFGNVMPTDIDAMADMKGRGFVIIETKFGTATLPFGQKLALERLTDSLTDGGKHAIPVVARSLQRR